MSDELQDKYKTSEGDRRQGSGFRLGIIAAVDTTTGKARVRVSDAQFEKAPAGDIGSGESKPGNTTDWLPWVAWQAGTLRVWHVPAIGEQVAVIAPSGEQNQGVILPGVFCSAFPPPSSNPNETRLEWEDGGFFAYDRTTHVLTIHVDCHVRIEGDLVVERDVIAADGGISLLQHIHCGVEPGGGCSDGPQGGSAPEC